MLCAAAGTLYAQTPVPVGSGSYASFIPPSENVTTESNTIYVLPGVNGPYPTNDWWTPLLTQDVVGIAHKHHIWAHPASYTVHNYGLGVHYSKTWEGDADHQIIAH